MLLSGRKLEERADVVERILFVFGEVVRDARAGVVRVGAAELLHADVLAGDRLDDVGAGDEHLAGLVDHDDEVGERGRVHRAAGGGAHDDRDLRDDSGCRGVEAEDLAVLAEGDDALLDAGAARVEHPDARHAAAHRELHDLDDLLARGLAERAAEGREVLRVDGDGAAVDRADARHDRIAVGPGLVHAERGRAVPHVFVELDERARVDELLDALAGRSLALRMLLRLRDRLGVDHGFLVAGAEVRDLAGGREEVGLVGHGFQTIGGGSATRWRVRTRGRGIRCLPSRRWGLSPDASHVPHGRQPLPSRAAPRVGCRACRSPPKAIRSPPP